MSPLAIIGNLLWLFLGPGIACFFFWLLAGIVLAITIVGLPFSFAGLWLAIFHVFTGVLHCITIIGIPFGLAHFKLANVSLAPLGKRSVSS